MATKKNPSALSLERLRRRIAAVDEDVIAALLRRSLFGKPAPHRAGPATPWPAGLTNIELLARARHDYERLALPALCAETEEDSEVADAEDRAVIAAVTNRLRLVAMIAATKGCSRTAAFRNLRAARDAAGLEAAITDPAIEAQVVARAAARAAALRPAGTPTDLPARVAAVYRDWIIPLARHLQVEILLATPARRRRPV